ncbi:MAG: hypothetical protein WCV81_03390 [Microgenomates group bacterium]|jgi:hypothetical protein
MSNISTTTNSLSTLPPTNERKNNIAPVLDSPENIEGIDRVGFFNEETPSERAFDANSGGTILFNLPKLENYPVAERTEIPQAFQKAFENDDESKTIAVSDLFKEGGYVALGAAKSGAGAITNIFKDTLGAVVDVVKNDIAFETPKEQKQDPEKQAEEQKKVIETQYQNQVMQTTEDEITSLRNKLENEARLAPLKHEIGDLVHLQDMLSGKSSIVKDNGEIRTDLQDDVARARQEIMKTQQGGSNGLPSVGKRGMGPKMSLDDNKSGETHSTAQTAVG